MKQIIVMLAMLILGIVIATAVLGFQDDVTAMETGANGRLSTLYTSEGIAGPGE